MDLFDYYMSAYMYELENCLNGHKEEFKNINFQQDEANTDKEVKKLIKDIIKGGNTTIAQTKSVEIDGKTVNIQKDKFELTAALTQEEYTEDDRKYIKSIKNGVYVNPDLLLKISFDGGEKRTCIEIKSTKTNNILGSSIQQIFPDEWVIFIKHTERDISIVTGKYKNTINGTMQFPDRSPRPQVSFSTLENWNKDYRQYNLSALKYINDAKENVKDSLLSDWQGFLAERWLKVLKSDKKNKGEPWFNNTLRKFSLILFEYYNGLTEEEKVEFIKKIKDNQDEEL